MAKAKTKHQKAAAAAAAAAEAPTVSIAGALLGEDSSSVRGSHRRSAEVVEALIDNQSDLRGKQLTLWLENPSSDLGLEFDSRGIELKVHRKGISLSPGAQKIYGVLLQKLGKSVVIENEEANLPTTVAPKRDMTVVIGGYDYVPPRIEVSPYEVIKETIGGRHPSGRDYEDYARYFQELCDKTHVFSMRIRHTSGNSDLRVVHSPVILAVDYPDVTEEQVKAIESDLDGESEPETGSGKRLPKRMFVSLHPIVISQLGNYWTDFPDDFEERLSRIGAGKSPHISHLAYLVCYERSRKTTKHKGYFERTEDNLIGHLHLEKYRRRRKDLQQMLNAAFEALKGWLVEKVEMLPTTRRNEVKFRIYPIPE